MGYTIFSHKQITPATVIRPGAQGGEVRVENPEQVTLPAGTRVVYVPADYSRFSADPACRMLLLDDPAGKATTEEIAKAFPDILGAKYARLWQAAHEWEQRNISGVGLSILTLGVAQGKPKALAVAAWSNALWMNLYYPRKAAITLDTEPDCDFNAAGDIPYSVPELSAEVWG
jgi:hypothetical protein